MDTKTSQLARPRFTRAAERARVVVIDGPDRGAHVVIGATPVRLGTSGESGLVLTDPSISRHHVEARWHAGYLAVVDLGSKNGTYAGGCRVRDADVPIGGGLRLGATTLKVLPDDEAVEPIASTATSRGSLVGASQVMRQLFTLIDQLAAADVSVVIEGETGVGKQAIAEAIHRGSARAPHPFTLLACGSLDSDDLAAMVAEADGGTVVLDDIGELDLDVQPALLHLIDRRVVREAGTMHDRPVDVRLIATSQHDLDDRIDQGALRDDVFYRLAVVRVAVPPLRERVDDIPLLVRAFAGTHELSIDDTALAAYTWPGNIRELQNVIARAIATGSIGELAPRRAEASDATFREAKAAAVERFERGYLGDLVARFTTLAAAATAAGMDRKHLRVLLRRHGLRTA
jgi:DNA-binding NtrC family response regulator